MYQDDYDHNPDDLDGSFWEAAFRSEGVSWKTDPDEDGYQEVTYHRMVFHPDDGDDHTDFESDIEQDDGLSPVRMQSGNNPCDYTSLTTQYFDLGDEEGAMWSHGIYQTDDQDARELRDPEVWEWSEKKSRWVSRDGKRKGSYNTGEQERRDLDLLLDPGARKIRDRQRVKREGHTYNKRKWAEHHNRKHRDEEYELEPELIDELLAKRNERQDFQEWLQKYGGRNGGEVSPRRAREIRQTIEELKNEQRDAHKAVIGYRDARHAGWISERERLESLPASKWSADGGAAGQQYDPASNQYSRSQMASIASQLIKHDGDITKVIVPPVEQEPEYDPTTPEQRREQLEMDMQEYLQRGGVIEQVESADDKLARTNPELHKRLKYRWLRWNRW